MPRCALTRCLLLWWWDPSPQPAAGIPALEAAVVPLQPHSLHPPSAPQDPSSQLLWWLAVVCDPAISQPGQAEVAGTGKPPWWPRDRSSRVPWQALEAILAELAAVGGDRQRYLDDYYTRWLHRFNVGAAGVVSRGVGRDGEHSGCPAPDGQA